MLPTSVQNKIDVLCEEGDRLLDEGRLDEALARYENAANLIPYPKEHWQATTWIYSAIGDAWFFKGFYSNALEAFQTAIIAPDGLGNPYIHLRLGQCHFELGNLDKAADELTRAYMGHGRAIFDDEPAKYADFLSTKITMD